MGSASQRGVSTVRVIAALALCLLLVYACSRIFRSEEEILADRIEEARRALVDKRDEDFLASFHPDVTYRGGGSVAELTADLKRWRAVGIDKVFILNRQIEMDPTERSAEVRLNVAVGSAILSVATVKVTLTAEKRDDGKWRVAAFDWSR